MRRATQSTLILILVGAWLLLGAQNAVAQTDTIDPPPVDDWSEDPYENPPPGDWSEDPYENPPPGDWSEDPYGNPPPDAWSEDPYGNPPPDAWPEDPYGNPPPDGHPIEGDEFFFDGGDLSANSAEALPAESFADVPPEYAFFVDSTLPVPPEFAFLDDPSLPVPPEYAFLIDPMLPVPQEFAWLSDLPAGSAAEQFVADSAELTPQDPPTAAAPATVPTAAPAAVPTRAPIPAADLDAEEADDAVAPAVPGPLDADDTSAPSEEARDVESNAPVGRERDGSIEWSAAPTGNTTTTTATESVASVDTIAGVLTQDGGTGQSVIEFGPVLPLLIFVAVASVALFASVPVFLGRRSQGHSALRELALTDDLRKLANRRRLDRDLRSYSRGGQQIAIAMVDIDHFKGLNDDFGHAIGDIVLQRVAGTISENVRRDDVVYRYGGEEFCVLLPATTEPEAVAVVDRVRRAIESIEFDCVDRTVTISAGVAVGGVADTTSRVDVEDAVHHADAAMYASKNAGRNRVSRSSLVTESLTPS